MAIPGKYNKLKITKIVDFGVYLDGGEYGEILLPMKWVPESSTPNDELDVFLYFDSSDRIIATTQQPLAVKDEFAYLTVKAVNPVGAFLDWGLDKDLLLPYREQKYKVEEGAKVIVYVYADDKNRIAASTMIEKYLDTDTSKLKKGQEVDLLIYAATDLGFKAIIDNHYEGVIYANQVFQLISRGQKVKGYINSVREDGKVDLSLYKTGYVEKIDELCNNLLESLKRNNGFLSITEKNSPEEIYLALGMSKKNFKQAVGKLYKLRKIIIDDSGIRLSE